MQEISLDRVLEGALRLSVLRGIYYDADGEEVGAVRDEIDFHPDGTFCIARGALHGDMSDDYREV